MFGTKTDVPMNEVKKLYDEAARRFCRRQGGAARAGSNLFFSARRDTGAVLSADGVTVTGGTEQAQNRPTTPEMVEKSLSKDRRHAVLYGEHAYRGAGRSDDSGVRDERHAPRCTSTFCWQNAAVAPSATGWTAGAAARR